MILFVISFIAGILTVLAPCILPLLPVIVGGAVSDLRSKWKPYIITASLCISIILFTLVLKASTVFIAVPLQVWQYLSGGIIFIFGLTFLFPDAWEKFTVRLNLLLSRKSNRLIVEGEKKNSVWGDVVIGAALGPVFSSCSPTYFLILASVLPQSFATGLLYLVVYAIGLALALLLIAKLGGKLVEKISGFADPHGWFKRTLGILFVVVGIFVVLGIDKKIQTAIISGGYYDLAKFEEKLIRAGEKKEEMPTMPASSKELVYPKFREIEQPGGYANSDPFTIGQYIGKQIVLLEIMTYSCINCQRTFPYVNAWYEKYKDKGLVIIGIHTPEFAFEHDIKNVNEAMQKFGIKFPVMLDNEYATWNAYGNKYWPRKYLIDIDGFIRFDHIGEGEYDVIEDEIRQLLRERSQKLGQELTLNGKAVEQISGEVSVAGSRETYFGAFRNYNFGNGRAGTTGEGKFLVDQY